MDKAGGCDDEGSEEDAGWGPPVCEGNDDRGTSEGKDIVLAAGKDQARQAYQDQAIVGEREREMSWDDRYLKASCLGRGVIFSTRERGGAMSFKRAGEGGM